MQAEVEESVVLKLGYRLHRIDHLHILWLPASLSSTNASLTSHQVVDRA